MVRDDAADVAMVEDQERRLVFEQFGYEDSWILGNIIVKLGMERDLPIAIDIMRGEQKMFHAALPGSTANNDRWIDRKSSVVRQHGVSSLLVGARARLNGKPFEDQPMNDARTQAAVGGCFPVNLRNSGTIGTVAVSGLPQRDDHALVVEAIELFLSD
ncbi:heme-degrading domain-containing protein [soil metagenome]